MTMPQLHWYQATYPYHGNSFSDQLSFESGAILVVQDRERNVTGTGWGYGQLRGTSQQGWFPISHVNPISIDEALSPSRNGHYHHGRSRAQSPPPQRARPPEQVVTLQKGALPDYGPPSSRGRPGSVASVSSNSSWSSRGQRSGKHHRRRNDPSLTSVWDVVADDHPDTKRFGSPFESPHTQRDDDEDGFSGPPMGVLPEDEARYGDERRVGAPLGRTTMSTQFVWPESPQIVVNYPPEEKSGTRKQLSKLSNKIRNAWRHGDR